jgi:glycosyltransferase involved in cell wall biosynthesis
MKILGILNGMSGISYHRLYAPLHDLQIRGFAQIDIWSPRDENGNYRPLPDLDKYDLVIWNGTLAEPQEQIISILNTRGIPFIVDIDDYWMLNRYNPAVDEWKRRGLSAKVQAALYHADAVICENDRLREQVYKVNRNVYTIPNALNLTELQWNQEKEPSDKFRVGFVGSRSHRYDLFTISQAVREFCEETGSEYNICGYDEKDPEWQAVGNDVAPVGHPDWLKLRPGVHPSQYGIYLSRLDVVLAPLVTSQFNLCKSDIKVKEAGCYSLPVIASDFGPYHDHASLGVYTASGVKEWKARLYEAYEGKLDGRPNAAYLEKNGDLHKVNLDRIAVLTEVLVKK